jgi:hypothetical protein
MVPVFGRSRVFFCSPVGAVGARGLVAIVDAGYQTMGCDARGRLSASLPRDRLDSLTTMICAGKPRVMCRSPQAADNGAQALPDPEPALECRKPAPHPQVNPDDEPRAAINGRWCGGPQVGT